jgi:hypothetical protein
MLEIKENFVATVEVFDVYEASDNSILATFYHRPDAEEYVRNKDTVTMLESLRNTPTRRQESRTMSIMHNCPNHGLVGFCTCKTAKIIFI